MNNATAINFSKLKPLNGKFCELCNSYFTGKWKEHISSTEHRSVYETIEYKSCVKSLDKVIHEGPTLETFLSDISANYPKEDKKETKNGQTDEWTVVRSEGLKMQLEKVSNSVFFELDKVCMHVKSLC